jgi:hypothetical protein
LLYYPRQCSTVWYLHTLSNALNLTTAVYILRQYINYTPLSSIFSFNIILDVQKSFLSPHPLAKLPLWLSLMPPDITSIPLSSLNLRPTIDKGVTSHMVKLSLVQTSNSIERSCLGVGTVLTGVSRAGIDMASLKPAKTGMYTNCVKWQTSMTSQSSCVLYNGNHRFTYMHYHSSICKAYTWREDSHCRYRDCDHQGWCMVGSILGSW